MVLDMNKWDQSSIRYMKPKVNDRGGKSINVISSQTNRGLHIILPMMMTWGISDYVDEKTGESDGKYTISLQFPREMDQTPETMEALNKLKAFEDQLLNDAVKYSSTWFDEEQEKAIVKHSYYSFLKYPKDKITGKKDFTKPPTLRAKVPNYQGVWKVQIFDTKAEQIFPCEYDSATPMEFVPKQSNVKAVIQCGGIWVGGKGWGLTWKLNQCVVKPQVLENIFDGGLKFSITPEESDAIVKGPTKMIEEQSETEDQVDSTYVADSDDDMVVTKEKLTSTPVTIDCSYTNESPSEDISLPDEVPLPDEVESKKDNKKVIKKKVKEPVDSPIEANDITPPIKKKVVKKAKVAAA